MAIAAQKLVALLSSQLQGNLEQSVAMVLQVAAVEARSGREKTAEDLRRLAQRLREAESCQEDRDDGPIPIARPKGPLASLVSVEYPAARLAQMVLAIEVSRKLKRVIRQQVNRAKLREFGKLPSRMLLLSGPPGSGKTMTAAALAGELRLPLFSVRLDAVVSRYMGETASHLRLIFDQVRHTRGVYLFDEFDALGADRGIGNDVAEARRILSSFLQFMEETNSTDSLIVCATNFAELLDGALPRRFDEFIVYGLPDEVATKKLLTKHLGHFRPKKIEWLKVLPHTSGLSHGEIVQAVDDAIKDAILDDKTTASSQVLLDALMARRSSRQDLDVVNRS
ncbi:MAG: ATP-binding protein [Pseudomonadota bacterium]